MLRLNVATDAVAVRANGIYHVVPDAALSEQLGSFFAVLLRIKLKIYVVKQTGNAPVILLVAIAEGFCKITHDPFDSQRVLNVKRLLIVFFEKRKCLVA